MISEPRRPDIVIAELNDLNKVIETNKNMAEKYVEDNFLKVSLTQNLHRKEQLMKELHLSMTLYYMEKVA